MAPAFQASLKLGDGERKLLCRMAAKSLLNRSFSGANPIKIPETTLDECSLLA